MCAVITKANILELTNLSRQENKVAILLENKQLNLAAQNKAVDIYTKKYWSHTAPNGKTPWDFITESGYSYQIAGENLAKDFKDSVIEQKAWLESEKHKDNILNPNFQDIGIGIKGTVVVVEFGGK